MTLLVIAALCTAVACVIGGASGFGAAMIATPLILIGGLDITDVVVVNLVVGLLTRLAAGYQLRRHVEWPRVLILDGASLPGAWLGTLVVTMLPQAVLKPAAGIVAVLCGMKCHGFDGE
ncbi:TSUP family transporter [Gordonia alkaliphila]|uniref:Probable membrane transporter protein n=1 Tax=Gordonia alkaliphila TaxID=1053547 RepID=A0ABP8Z0Y0_9ACTN